MTQTAKAEAVSIDDTPNSLKAALMIIELARERIAEATREIEDAKETLADAEQEIEELKEEIEDLESSAIDEDVIIDMERCLQKLKAGRIQEATSDLDLLIARNDGACKRMSAVAVML